MSLTCRALGVKVTVTVMKPWTAMLEREGLMSNSFTASAALFLAAAAG